MEFIWETLCEVGEFWLIMGGFALMVAVTKFKKWRNKDE